MESTASADGAALQSRVSDLENEVSRLKDQLVKAKSLNDSMWESVVSTVMTSDQPASDGAAAEGRMKKRTRLAS
jgi:pre-rRNA-processing protein IPI3